MFEDDKKVTSKDYILICRKCLICFDTNKLAKDHCCDNTEFLLNEVKEDYLKDLIKEIKRYEKYNKKIKEKLLELENKVKYENIKNDLVIKLVDTIKNDKNIIDMDKLQNITITINQNNPIKSKSNGDVIKYSPTGDKNDKNDKNDRSDRNDKKKKEHYISAEKIIDNIISEKTIEEKKEIVEVIEKKMDEKAKKYYDESKETLLEVINKSFISFEKDKNFDTLKVIKEKRLKLLKIIGLEEYIKQLDIHFNKINTIITNKKMDNKSNKIFQLLFSVLDTRLLFLECCQKIPLEFEDIDRFHIGLDSFKKTQIDITPFNQIEMIKNILTYDLALSDLKQVLRRELIDKAGFNNIVYIIKDGGSNHREDPFLFYYLEKIEKGKRCWKMDCRLEEITHEIRNHVLTYCQNLFKKLYNCVYHDNVYRSDFSNFCPITEFECEQLIQNIITVSHFYKFSKLVQSIIIENASYTPTSNDKFHLYADDKMQQKNYKMLAVEDFTNDILDNLSELFDDPVPDEIKALYNSKKNF